MVVAVSGFGWVSKKTTLKIPMRRGTAGKNVIRLVVFTERTSGTVLRCKDRVALARGGFGGAARQPGDYCRLYEYLVLKQNGA